MLDFILKYWIEIFFTIVVSGFGFTYKKIVEKIKEGERKQVAIEEGIQALLRERIIQNYNIHMDKGFCTIHSMEDIEALYTQYTALGGNGTVKSLIDKLKELPTEEQKEE